MVAHLTSLGGHTGSRRGTALKAEEHRRAPPAAAKVFQSALSRLQTAAYAKIILIVARLTFRVLWSAAKADAARTDIETGFAFRLRTNKSCVHQNSRFLAVMTFRLLLDGTLRAVVLAIGDADARIA